MRCFCSFIHSPAGDLPGQECRVTADPAEQGGAAGVLPGEAEHVQAGRGRHAPLVHDVSLIVFRLVDVDPRVVRHEPGGPHDGVEVRGAAVGEGHGLPGRARRPGPDPDAVVAGEFPRPGPDHLVPPASRFPSRESAVTLSSRSAVAHAQMSRPSGRWGMAGSRWPAESSTRWVAESSWAIWQPEFAAPTTRTFPGGTLCGRR